MRKLTGLIMARRGEGDAEEEGSVKWEEGRRKKEEEDGTQRIFERREDSKTGRRKLEFAVKKEVMFFQTITSSTISTVSTLLTFHPTSIAPALSANW